jgi:hypothetical protein
VAEVLTADQITDFRKDIADVNEAFSPDELNRLYARAQDNYGKTAGVEAYNQAVALAYRQLLANANKLANYSAGSTSESLAQVRNHIKDSLTYWETEVVGKATPQVAIARLRRASPRVKDKP